MLLPFKDQTHRLAAKDQRRCGRFERAPVYIRDLLGPADISTTELYAWAYVESKMKLLEDLCLGLTPSDELYDWSRDQNLLDYLNNKQ